jgi:hypothetical protein
MNTRNNSHAEKIELLLEAARRANWDALHGPMHLRTGRFHPERAEGEALENPTFVAPQQRASDGGGGVGAPKA